MTEVPSWMWVLACSGAIVLVAFLLRSLSPSGAIVAFAIGAVSLRAGWGWGALLVSWFVLSSVLSRWGKRAKEARTHAIVAKGGRRDAWQVLANGGVFAAAALANVWFGEPGSQWTLAAIVGASALAAAAADTWATEIGTMSNAKPRSIRSWAKVPTGTSGAVSLVGSVAMVLGALTTALLAVNFAVLPHSGRVWLAVAVGGITGALFDTLLGAFAQERRYCTACKAFTERAIHDCGAPTEVRSGIRRLDNDVVNALCTMAGGAVALTLTLFFHL